MLYVAFQLRSAELTSQTALDAMLRQLDGTPVVVVVLAQVPTWTQVAGTFALCVGFLLMVGRAERRPRVRRCDWEDA